MESTEAKRKRRSKEDFEGRVFPADQSEFEQNMLAKGDVRKIVIVNDKVAEITINADSLKLKAINQFI